MAVTPPNSHPYNQNSDDSGRRKKGWLLPLLLLLGLLVLGGIVFSALHKDSDDTSSNATNSSQKNTQTSANQSSSQNTQSYKTKFEAAVPAAQRILYFQADSTTLQDPAATDTALTTIAAFAKANPQAKIVINGSVFDGQPGQQGEPLAQQRAALIKQQLVSKGVADASIQTTATNTYTGNTDAAKAEYARSVTIYAQ